MAAALFAVTVVHLLLLPRALAADESYLLYEAARIVQGARLYRDMFVFQTPGPHYVVAAAFWLFGASMATARGLDAVVHGLIVVLVYETCRALGVRRALAAVVALLDPAVFRPAWAQTSQHWITTVFMLLLLRALLRPRDARGREVVLGVSAGVLTGMQHHQGAVVVPIVAAVLVWEHWTAGGTRAWVGALARFALGGLLVLVPLAIHLVQVAGAWTIFESLILFPFGGYRAHNQIVSYGYAFTGITPHYTSPGLVAALPVVAVVLTVARAGWLLLYDGDTARRRQAVAVAAACVAVLLSIAYYPDFVHLAFIGPIEAIGVAYVVEAGLRRAPSAAGWPARITGGVAVAGLFAVLFTVLAVQLIVLGVRYRRAYPYACDSVFGTVWFESELRCTLLHESNRELREAGVRELFAYPLGSWVNLLTATVNPTRYSFLVRGYDPPDHYREAIRELAHRRDAWVVVWMPLAPDDPLGRFLARDYARVHPEEPTSGLYRQKRARRQPTVTDPR